LVAVMLAMAVLAGVVVLVGRSRKPVTPPRAERLVSELVRQDGGLADPATGRLFTGWLLDRYPDGALRSKSWLSNGVLQGLSEGWYPNGVQEIREHFVAGKSQGSVTRWREDGTMLSEGIAVDGRLEGIFRRWHSNGQLAEEATLRLGVPEGVSRAWYPDGSLRAEVQLDGGTVVRQQFWKAGERPAERVEVASRVAP
jgi:antitoxin component YwqK of YwqJK toxin-antitoxin module